MLGQAAHFGVTFSGRAARFGCARCSSDGDVCGECEPSYTLSQLTNAHPKYAQIKQQFADSWVLDGTKPTVLRVLQVQR
jgi:hypothetical protein